MIINLKFKFWFLYANTLQNLLFVIGYCNWGFIFYLWLGSIETYINEEKSLFQLTFLQKCKPIKCGRRFCDIWLFANISMYLMSPNINSFLRIGTVTWFMEWNFRVPLDWHLTCRLHRRGSHYARWGGKVSL